MTKVAIVGASGYTGLELIKIVIKHPLLDLSYLSTSNGGEELSTMHPSLKNIINIDISKANVDDIIKSSELVFLALPHKTAMAFVKPLMKSNIKIVDLSADYRLDLDLYEKHYVDHSDPSNLKNAVYGLSEFYKKDIQKSQLVANPGCYPTASLLGFLPFSPYVDNDAPLFIDAKSGVSGAGKKLSNTTHFVNVSDNFFAYNPMNHRHAPEIKEKITKLFNKNINVIFVPHLLPLTRGMQSSMYVVLNQNIDAKALLKNFYKDDPFIRIKDEPVQIKNVGGTHFCDIFVKQKGLILHIESVIDNLLRGASSSAVVNANLMLGIDEYIGIPDIAYAP